MSLRELAESPAAYVHVATVATGETWDPTDVVSAVLLMRKPGGTEVSWSATLSAASSTSVTLTHVLAATGTDLPRGTAGLWACRPKLTLSGGGVVYAATVSVPVKGAFEV